MEILWVSKHAWDKTTTRRRVSLSFEVKAAGLEGTNDAGGTEAAFFPSSLASGCDFFVSVIFGGEEFLEKVS